MEIPQVIDSLGDADQRDLVTFRLGHQTYALPIEPITRIIEMVTITSLPQIGGSVEGVINVQGRAVPVINMRRHFGLSEVPLDLRTPIIIIRVGAQLIGLIVDEVIDVLSLSSEEVSRVAEILPDGLGESPILEGIVHAPDETVLLLDVEGLLSSQQASILAEAISTFPEAIVVKEDNLKTEIDEGESEAEDESETKDESETEGELETEESSVSVESSSDELEGDES